ncbi:MAG: GNAT family N-acetyltransferase [Acidobacteria bacterium]|nr:GNAT family N-acetyltransferase [Acidobacteriota bacterium]MCA1640406.1 GNAT family N-acetyltransferase [Acidobacteriota bacterium]
MIVELKPDDFPHVLPLYRASGARFPLISAVVQNRQRGQVFADQPERPRAAVIVNNFGFTCVVGAQHDEPFDAGLAELLNTTGALRPTYLLWYAPPARWQQRLDALAPESIRRRERARFEFRRGRAAWLGETEQCPAGFELKKLDEELVTKTEKFGIELGTRFWSSVEDFVEHGLGVCLVKDGEVVSLCYAAAVADGFAEVDVLTDAEHRGRGLASLVARQFIRECLAKGITPTWDCFVANAGSMKLAQKLEFDEVSRYSFYSFNTPIEFGGHGEMSA